MNYYLSMTLIASMFMLASCGEDTDEDLVGGPAITFGAGAGDDNESTVDVGETVSFDINVTAPGGINRVYVQKNDETTYLVDTARASGDVPTTFTVPFSYTPIAEEAGETILFDINVVGEDDQDATATYTIIVNEQQVVTYNTVLLAAPVESQENEVWFSTSQGEKYSTQEVNDTEETLSEHIDFGYRYGPTAGATLASPAAYPSEGGQNISEWSVLNETMLRRVSTGVTATEFLEMGTNSGDLVTAYDDATADDTAPQRLNGLNEGDVLAFMTDPDKEGGSRYGLIYVQEINLGADGTGYGSDASVTLDVRVQASE